MVRLNGLQMSYGGSRYSRVRTTFNEVVNSVPYEEWTCVHCAEYRRSLGSIVATVRRDGREESSRRLTMDELDCRGLSGKRLECIDPEFGIFEIPWRRWWKFW